jgi:DNA polymerase alpha subunit A
LDDVWSTGWSDSFQDDGSSIQSESATDVQVDTSQIPMVTKENGDQVLRFYWLDAYEDQYKHPGKMFM